MKDEFGFDDDCFDEAMLSACDVVSSNVAQKQEVSMASGLRPVSSNTMKIQNSHGMKPVDNPEIRSPILALQAKEEAKEEDKSSKMRQNLLNTLKTHFGYPGFRDDQGGVVEVLPGTCFHSATKNSMCFYLSLLS